MPVCPKCHRNLPEGSVFCGACGTKLAGASEPRDRDTGSLRTSEPSLDYGTGSYDHTMSFEKKDISDNKVICMFIYLGGFLGLLWAFLSQESPFVKFHLRQAMKIHVFEIILSICCFGLAAIIGSIGLLAGTVSSTYSYYDMNMALRSLGGASVLIVIIMMIYGCFMACLQVVSIICFFHICGGKAIEAPIVRGFRFLR